MSKTIIESFVQSANKLFLNVISSWVHDNGTDSWEVIIAKVAPHSDFHGNRKYQ